MLKIENSHKNGNVDARNNPDDPVMPFGYKYLLYTSCPVLLSQLDFVDI